MPGLSNYLPGKRVHIAGSISPSTSVSLRQYAHDLIRRAVLGILKTGGGLVLGVGREPRPEGDPPDSPSLTFDWTALETFATCLQTGPPPWPRVFGSPLVIVTSEKSISEIPQNRYDLWTWLLQSGTVRLESILPGSRSATMIREKQARFGDILLILGGGTGVEHLAQLHMKQHRPVIPLDLPIGASRSDGTGGSERLAQEALAEPHRFLVLKAPMAETIGARLAGLGTRNGNTDVKVVAENITALIRDLAPQRAFYVRLLNQEHKDYPEVEAFFRNVVDQVVEEAGYERCEMGTTHAEHGFMNVAIFEGVHFSAIVIADLTGLRPNCFIELGYALGNNNRVIITARRGTVLPFDTSAIPCHFWPVGASDSDRRALLVDFWKKNINRPPLVAS